MQQDQKFGKKHDVAVTNHNKKRGHDDTIWCSFQVSSQGKSKHINCTMNWRTYWPGLETVIGAPWSWWIAIRDQKLCRNCDDGGPRWQVPAIRTPVEE